MVDIKLEEKTDPYTDGKDQVAPKKEEYRTNFYKITYEITFSKNFVSSIWFSLGFSNPHNVFIRYKKTRTPFTYYVIDESHVLVQVQVYYSISHPNIPLIIGFKQEKSDFKYYTFLQLTKQSWSYGFPPGGFTDKDLEARLIEENRTRNKIKFVDENVRFPNHNLIEDGYSISKFLRLEYSAKDDESSREHLISANILFSKVKLADMTIINKLLDDMKNNHYEYINVYFVKKDNSVVLFEFILGSTKIYLQRKDEDGYYWDKRSFSHSFKVQSDPEVEIMRKEIEKRFSFQLDKSANEGSIYGKNKVEVTDNQKSGYTVYKHCIKPEQLSNIQKTNVLYNNKQIWIVNNENITQSSHRLQNVSSQNFTEIRTFSLASRINEHLLIRLTDDKKNNYYIRKFDKSGTRWRQLTKEEVKLAGVDVGGLNDSQGLGQQLEGVLNHDSKWILLLEYINFEVNSVVILINMILPYARLQIQEIVGTNESQKFATPLDMDNNSIDVLDVTGTNGKCLKAKGYIIRKHNLQKAFSSSKEKGDSPLYLRLYLYKNQLNLYNNQDANGSPRYLTYQNNMNDFYVYFYGESSTRPLLLCYNNETYKAKEKDNNNTKWILDNNIKQCGCKGIIETGNEGLLKALDQSKLSNIFHLYEQSGEHHDYTYSKLFKYYEHHQPLDTRAANIEIYKKNDNKKLSLIPDRDYKTKACSRFEVYYNRFDNTDTPLILLLTFRETTNRLYYELSKFEHDIKARTKNISKLNNYNTNNFLNALVDENDKLKDFLTFNINKTVDKRSREQYNSKKINVVEDSESVSQLSSHGFKRYKHTPEQNYTTKKSCVMYNSNPLLYWTGTSDRVIDDFQGKVLKTVYVYYSNKNASLPLLVGFEIKKNGSFEWKYYYNRMYNQGLYWQKVDSESSFNIAGQQIDENKVHDELTKSSYAILIKVLNKVEFILLNTVVLLIEKRGLYSKDNADESIKKFYSNHMHDPKSTDVQPERISVTPKNIECTKLKQLNYKVFEHEIDLNKTARSLKTNKIELRLMIPASDGNGKYNELKLYKSDDFTEQNRELLIYTKTGSRTTILNVYFYGDDPRPLLLCYENGFYIPPDNGKYFDKWKKIDSIKSCPSDKSEENQELFTALNKVVKFLNRVQLEKKLDQSPYDVHHFNGTSIKVEIELMQNFHSTFCYNKFIHKPSKTGYSLGDIIHNNDNSKLTYSSESALLSVGVYYYKYDSNYAEPLLIELNFSSDVIVQNPGSNYREYYKLSVDTTSSLSWTKGNSDEIGREITLCLDKLRYKNKEAMKIEIANQSQYECKTSEQTENTFTRMNGNMINVSEEQNCNKLKEANYKYLKHNISGVDDSTKYKVGSLKITIPGMILKEGDSKTNNSDQDMLLYDIKPNQESELIKKVNEEKESQNLYDKISQHLVPYTPIYYTCCMGDMYVYYYVTNNENGKPSKGDPRPGLLCFNGRAYKPLKLPQLNGENFDYTNEVYRKWISVMGIKKCGCDEPEKLIEVLNDVYNIEILNIALIAGSSAGGLVGVVTIAGIIFLIIKKVSSVSATAAAVATVAL